MADNQSYLYLPLILCLVFCISLKIKFYFLALHCVIQSGVHSSSDYIVCEMVKTLLHFGADINAQNTEGKKKIF